jgi:hypothetical protein
MPRLHRLAGSARVGPSTFASEPLALEQVYARGRDAGRSDGHAPIAAALHVPIGRTSILVSSLYMACAIAQPTAGKLAEEFGPRRVFLILKTLEIGHSRLSLCPVARARTVHVRTQKDMTKHGARNRVLVNPVLKPTSGDTRVSSY